MTSVMPNLRNVGCCFINVGCVDATVLNTIAKCYETNPQSPTRVAFTYTLLFDNLFNPPFLSILYKTVNAVSFAQVICIRVD